MWSVVDIPSYGRRGCTTSSGLYMWITVLGSDCRCEGPGEGDNITVDHRDLRADLYYI